MTIIINMTEVKMKHNMSSLDRILRFALALLVGMLIYFNVINGTLANILGVAAGIFLVTSLIGFCPLYVLFRFSTKK